MIQRKNRPKQVDEGHTWSLWRELMAEEHLLRLEYERKVQAAEARYLRKLQKWQERQTEDQTEGK